MAKKRATKIDMQAFDNWLSELFIATEAMEYVLDLMPNEHVVLSNTLAMFQSRLADLLIEGHDRWIGSGIAFPMQRPMAGAQRKGSR